VVTANYTTNDVTELLNTLPSGTLGSTNNGSTFDITGTNSGTLNGQPFSNISSLTGGLGNDSFVFQSGGSLTGNIDGGGGNDTLDYSTISGASISVNGVGATGYFGTGSLIGGTFTNISTLVGGSGASVTVNGPFNNNGLSLTLNGTFALTINGTLSGSGTIINNASVNGTGTSTTPMTVGSGQTLTPAANGLPGVLTTGPVDFQGGSTYQVLFNGTTQSILDVTNTVDGASGTVDLTASPNLMITPTNFNPTPNQAYVILQSMGPITGNFNGLPQGAQMMIAGQPFVIDYIHAGKSGKGNSFPNRIVLTSLPAATAVAVTSSVPAPVTGQSVTFTATVSVPATSQASGAARPVPRDGSAFGTVTFFDNGVQQGGPVDLSDSPLNNGTATLTETLSQGSHFITAVYGGMGTIFSASPVSPGQPVVVSPPTPPFNNPNPGDPIFATGADAGGGPQVNVYDAKTGVFLGAFFAYDPRFLGGVRVAVGDVNGDGVPDIITAPGPGGGPDIRVFDGRTGTQIAEFLAYDFHFDTGVFVAVADIFHTGFVNIITSPDQGGGPDIRIFDGKSVITGQSQMVAEFLAYNFFFEGGVRIAVGDVNGDGTPDIITAPGPSGGPDIRVFSGASLGLNNQATMIGEFLAYDFRFEGGVYVAAADFNGDGKADIVTAPDQGGGPDIRIFDGNGVPGGAPVILNEFMAYDPSFLGGVRVGTVDVNGVNDVLTIPGPSGGSFVREFNALTSVQLDQFLAYNIAFLGGAFVGGH
jgi:hypothetical protein